MSLYRPKLIEERSNQELKEGIIIALREIIFSFTPLTEIETKVRKIQLSHFELDKRKDSIYQEVSDLEKQLNLKFTQLFEDCISYPDKSIFASKYYSQEDKKTTFCLICEEYQEEVKEYNLKICNTCLNQLEESFREKIAFENCLLFQTPEKKYWCKHAHESTLLLQIDIYAFDKSTVICEKCLLEEKNSRD